MPSYTIEALYRGDSEIVKYYATAKRIWQDILAHYGEATTVNLASELTKRQSEFENDCGGRAMGQEIMAVVGIAQFYSTEIGFDSQLNQALRVRDALRLSYCSLEVKYHTDRIAELLGLGDQ